MIALNNCQIEIGCVAGISIENTRIVVEFVEAYGPVSFDQMCAKFQLTGWTVARMLAEARDLGLIKLENGKYEIVRE